MEVHILKSDIFACFEPITMCHMSWQDTFIYIVLHRIQIVSKKLHINKQDNNRVNVVKLVHFKTN